MILFILIAFIVQYKTNEFAQFHMKLDVSARCQATVATTVKYAESNRINSKIQYLEKTYK